MIFLTCAYVLMYEVGLDIEDDYDQPSINYITVALFLWLLTKPLSVFTYYDDLILTY